MNLRKRLEGFANEVKTAGLNGESMNDKLASVIAREDLSPNEVRRIAEMANRGLQLDLYKVAEDKRFKFALCDPEALVGTARKIASASVGSNSDRSKIAAAIDEAGGDPFAPLPRQGQAEKLSLLQHPVDEKIAFAQDQHEARGMLLQLDRTRLELEQIQKEGMAAKVEAYDKANQAYKTAVQSAVDLLIGGGIKFPDLYSAIRAAVAGSRADVDAQKHADMLALAVLEGLEDRGIENHQLGFRFRGDPAALNKLSNKDILALAKRACGIPCNRPEATDISIQTQKSAQRYLEMVTKVTGDPKHHHPFQDAAEYLGVRPSQSKYPVPSPYLDEAVVSNTPGGNVRVVDADCEFVIGIQDLVGEQQRLTRIHAAQEYLGLKLKQIEETMRKLQGAQKVAAAEFEARMKAAEEVKEGWAGLAAGAARALPAAGRALAGAGRALKGLSTDTKVMGGLTAAQMAQSTHQQNKQIKHDKEMARGAAG